MIRGLRGCAAGFMAGRRDWFLTAWSIEIAGSRVTANGILDATGSVLRGEFDTKTETIKLMLEGNPADPPMAPRPAVFDGAWIGNRFVGVWRTSDESLHDGGRFEIWSEEKRMGLANQVRKGGEVARDMTWEQYVQYRDQGVFTLEDESGLWQGSYVDKDGQATEDLQVVFTDGLIRGRGHDKDGDFVVTGSYHNHSLSVHWRKHYVHPHRVFEYRGWWRGGVIKGRWVHVGEPDYNGPFSIEPHSMPESTHLAFAASLV